MNRRKDSPRNVKAQMRPSQVAWKLGRASRLVYTTYPMQNQKQEISFRVFVSVYNQMMGTIRRHARRDTKAVFETLRWAERVNGATQILFPEILENETHKHEALTLALKDRLTRAAGGVVVDSLN